MRRSARRRALVAASLFVILVAASIAAAADAGANLESGVRSLATTLRLGISIASIGVYAPTWADCRLLAQRLVNLLEGIDGDHYVPSDEGDELSGMIPSIAWVGERCESHGLTAETRARALAASQNVSMYLSMALDSALAVLRTRSLESATKHMLAVYAFLSAACETPCTQSTTSLVPAIRTIMSLLGVEAEDID